jgi:P27 family predicted phage terminase small subunit
MGRAGPPPKPTNLRILHGEPPYRVNRYEPQPLDARPPVPPDLSGAERWEWDRVVTELEAMNLAFAADRDVIRAYVTAVVMHAEAARMVVLQGMLIRGRDQALVRNPAVAMVRDSASMIIRLARELGLTPAARASFNTGGSAHEEDDGASLLSGSS